MTTRTARKSLARGGFTLIELMIVITIIAILAALLLAGIMPILSRGAEATARSEIAKLELAIASARLELNNCDFLPSFLVLREDNLYWNTANGVWVSGAQPLPQYASTIAALQKAFGKNIDLTSTNGIDWNGNGGIDSGKVWTLQGHHCLVFWLGGIPTNPNVSPGCLGFSTNPKNPSDSTTATRKGPFYPDFKANRLKRDSDPNVGGFMYYLDPFNDPNISFPGSAGLSYADQLPALPTTPPISYPFSRPFAYFSSAAGGNNYSINDCASLKVAPYYEDQTFTRFMNRNGFQIISAGKDGMFGLGGKLTTWTSTKGIIPTTPTSTDNWGLDDFANFSKSKLQNAAN